MSEKTTRRHKCINSQFVFAFAICCSISKGRCGISATFKSHGMTLCVPRGVRDICDYLNNRGMGRMQETPTEAQRLALKAMSA